MICRASLCNTMQQAGSHVPAEIVAIGTSSRLRSHSASNMKIRLESESLDSEDRRIPSVDGVGSIQNGPLESVALSAAFKL